ncbi:LuxR C-terminal-related transcriptional regulator [Patulibacter minatonensis]|uniref:LuxR C-terminal-related transcriptional regulator n=1 Tax=Patulibacter minatonensis TaxID=298163 RepID=UPI0006860958|nr:LuxR C-terminal-related transcriptional regulator [Patulibacter minatonensis]
METDDWRRVRRLHQSGVSIKGIARELGMARNTVRKALAATDPPADGRRQRPSALDPLEPRIAALLQRDPDLPATEIARRLGWEGSMTTLRTRVRRLRDANAPAAGDGGRLPAEVTSLVGRREQLQEIRRLLGTTRLVTLTGGGGIGKTRLAVAVAARLRRSHGDDVRLVELAALRDPTLLAQTIVDQLGLGHHDGSLRSHREILEEHLGARDSLLVLDNCEHLLPACAELVRHLLRAAPGLRVLCTSRQALGLDGEHLLVVPPLGLGDTDAPAVALFAERAAAVVPGFTADGPTTVAIGRICRHLDGVPLAIELAATQLRLLSVDDLERRLADRMFLLTATGRHGPERHRSLQAAMDWSRELCSPLERRVWARASVFAGGFDLAAAEAVLHGVDPAAVFEAVGGLVDKSILRREEHDGRVRFRMLEPIAEAGFAQLDVDEREDARRRHLAWCVGLAGGLTAEWAGPAQEDWYRRIRLEHANLRSALEFAIGDGRDPRAAQVLTGRPWFLWAILSLTEHRLWLTRALALDASPTPERARALGTFGLVTTMQGDRDAAREPLAEAERIGRELGDPLAVAWAVHGRGLTAFFSGEFGPARELLLAARSAYEEHGAPPDQVGALDVHLGLLGVFDTDFAWAQAQFERVALRSEGCGERWLLAYATAGLAFGDLAREELDRAGERALAGLRAISGFHDAIGVSLTLDLLAWVEAGRGDSGRAAVLFGAASGSWRSFGEQLYGSDHWIAERERFEGRVRSDLGASAFGEAFDRGVAMPRDRTLALALRTNEAASADGTGRAGDGAGVALTAREADVAELVAEGLTNRDIAERLGVSRRTVDGHVSNALRKLGFERRALLAVWASRSRITR